MARRTFTQIDAVARGHERIGVKLHAAEHARRIDVALAAGRIDAETAAATKLHLEVFADECATGLHVEGHDSAETRRTVRRMLGDAGMLRGVAHG